MNDSSSSPTPSRFVVSSLRWKILGWFFVNLAVVAAVIFGFLRAQFGLGIDSLLAGPTGDRLEAIARPLTNELRRLPPGAAWEEALARAVGPYQRNGDGVRAGIVSGEGTLLAGELPAIPAEVSRLLTRPRRGEGEDRGERPPPPPEGGRRGPPPPDGGGSRDGRPPPPPDAGRPPPGEPPPGEPGGRMRKFMLSTSVPRLYWAGIYLVNVGASGSRPGNDNGGPDRAGPVAALVLASDSLRGGGLFFDYVPWLTLGGGLALLSVLLWLPFVGRLTRGLTAMTGLAEGIAEGRFRPLPRVSTRRDELGRLGRALGHMAVRLEGFVTGQKRFLGDTAHELLSPLARLEVSLSIWEQRAANPAEREQAERAVAEVHHLAGIVRDLLLFTKSELRAAPVALRSVPLLELARGVVAREGAGAEVQVNVPTGLCALTDPDLLDRALGNAVRNAVRYAGEAGPITVFAAANAATPMEVSLTVSDQGPGVPAEALGRLFDPFYRPDGARARETGGTGLGLAIVKSCVEACGGSVSARNRTAAGLAVVFRLPRAMDELK